MNSEIPFIPPFRPYPLLAGGHLQTIAGAFLPYTKHHYRAVQHQVPLPDGDHIVLHDDCPGASSSITSVGGKLASGAPAYRVDRPAAAPTWQPGDTVVILVHGLGGCHLSSYMQRSAAKLAARGTRVFRMDLRGCGAGFAVAKHPLHAGRSEDAAAVLSYVRQLCPGSPVHVAGFSMGANIILKMAGELGDAAPPELASVLAVSPPIDLIECAKNIRLGHNRLYDRRFVTNLLAHVRRRERLVPGAHTRPLNPPPRQLVEFDDRFTAPLSGFAGVNDYYERASSGPLLKHIAVPTLIIAAATDPIVPLGPYEQASYSPTTRLVITPCGGHLGFIGRRGTDPDRRWLDWRLLDWVAHHSRPRANATGSSAGSPRTVAIMAASR